MWLFLTILYKQKRENEIFLLNQLFLTIPYKHEIAKWDPILARMYLDWSLRNVYVFVVLVLLTISLVVVWVLSFTDTARVLKWLSIRSGDITNGVADLLIPDSHIKGPIRKCRGVWPPLYLSLCAAEIPTPSNSYCEWDWPAAGTKNNRFWRLWFIS